MTLACLEAFETLMLRLISAPCMILPEVSSDATCTVATYALSVGIASLLLQDQGGGLQPIKIEIVYNMYRMRRFTTVGAVCGGAASGRAGFDAVYE
jgi:hypothetical protein